MRSILGITALLGSVLLLAGCATEVKRPVHLYPVSQSTTDTAVLQGIIVGHGQGHGTARVEMPDGEVLQGEYSIVFGGTRSFGSILGSVYGQNGAGTVYGTSTAVSIDGEGQG